MRCKGRERGADGPRGGATGRALSTGFPESDHTAFGEGEGKTVTLTPGLSGIHKRLEGRGGGGNKSKIVHEKKNCQGKKEGGRREVEGWEELLQGGDKIGNVQAPKEGGETSAFWEALELGDVGSSRVVAM